MRVLILNPILYTSETDRIPKTDSVKDTMIYALCEGFVQNGDEPVLVAAQDYRPVNDEAYPFPILWMPCKFRRIFKPRCLPFLKGLGGYLRKHACEYDYIISSEVFSMLTLTAALYARGRLIIWHELGAHNNILKKIPSRLWYHVVARIFMKNIPVVPRSDRARTFIRRFCDPVLDVTIDHGVDLEKVVPDSAKEDYFVVVSQLIERKHIDDIIRIFGDFCERSKKKYELKIIGDGILREELQRLAQDMGLAQSVRFYGKLNHEKLMPILAKARAMLVNTSKDNSMVSIVESIAAGTPVITTPVPFNAAYIESEGLGIVKDRWTFRELEEICGRNEYYVERCIRYRDKLSNRYLAGQFDLIGDSLADRSKQRADKR